MQAPVVDCTVHGLVQEVLPVGVRTVRVGPLGFLVSLTSIMPSDGERTWTYPWALVLAQALSQGVVAGPEG